MWYKPKALTTNKFLGCGMRSSTTSYKVLQKQKETFTFLFRKKHDNKTSQSSQEQKCTQRSLSTKPDVQKGI